MGSRIKYKYLYETYLPVLAAEFCMTIQQIKPNDIFQSCVHSTITLMH